MADDIEEPGEEEATSSDNKLDEVHARAIRRFDECVLPQMEQRALALLARRFVSIPGAQWEGEWGESFENGIKMEINKTARGLEKIVRDYRENRIIPDFRPAGGKGDPGTAATLDGIHRADSYHFKAQQARDNAFEEAAAGGFGAYRLVNDWADPYDKDSDEQRINPGLIIADADQSVYFDNNSKLYDKSDARFAYVLSAVSRDAFEEEYEGHCVDWPTSTPLSKFDWYTPEVVIKCEYYEVENRDEKLLIFTMPVTGEEQRWWSSDIETDAITDLKDKGWKQTSRSQKRKRVHKYVMSGAEVLKDNGFIAGNCIPIVPVYGKRWYVDGQERFCGHVQMKMDAQRLYNSMVSHVAEANAQSPRDIPIFAVDQMPPAVKAMWARQVVDRHAYAIVEPLKDDEGRIVSAGPIGKVEAASVSPTAAALLQIANNDLTEEDQDADQVVANTSAEAMDLAATRIDAKSGLYLDNMKQSVQREGEIYLSMAADVYWEEGREVETMSEDGDDGIAVLSEIFTDPNTGKNGVRNDFTRGKYKVVADVTEATATRRDKTVKSSLNIATVAQQAGDQELAQVAMLTAVMNQDGEGMSDFQKYARAKLVAMGIVEPNDDEKAQMEQAQQNQQPDPTQQLAAAQATDLAASAALKGAQAQKAQMDTEKSRAETVLKYAQATTLGGPEQAPAVPDGLDQAHKIADINKKQAETDHLRATTEHLPQQLSIEAHNAETKRMQAVR